MQTAVVSNGSRLSQMQARFQQKQLQQKEEKMLRLYETQQQRVLDRVGRGSAGSDASTASSSGGGYIGGGGGGGGGKVRQMFDERRTVHKAGFDRSYPLEPIKKSPSNGITGSRSNGHTVATRGTSLDRFSTYTKKPSKTTTSTTSTVTKTTAYRSKSQLRSDGRTATYAAEYAHASAHFDDGVEQARSVHNETYRRDYVDDEYDDNDNAMFQLKKQQRELEEMMNNHNMNETLDDEDFPDIGLVEDDAHDTNVFGRLPNVGRILPSERVVPKAPEVVSMKPVAPEPVVAKKQTPAAPERRNVAAAKRTGVSGDRHERISTSRSPPVENARKTVTRAPPQTPATASKTTVRKSATPSPHTSTPSSARSSPTKLASPMSKGATGVKAATKTSNTTRASAASNVDRDGLVPCNLCGRRFASDRLGVHQNICAKTAAKKRKPYDASKHRIQGTEAEQYTQKKGKLVRSSQPQTLKKSDWRRKHEDFINAIRSAKQAQAHVAAGGKLSDLPPPPPSQNPDYVECPHCKRKFNQAAAERHIPKCADYQFNKPAPKAGTSKKR